MDSSCEKIEKEEFESNHTEFLINKQDLISIKTTKIREDYSISCKIGEDKFANICLCKSKITKDHYAVKIFSVTSIEPKVLENFINEAEVLEKLITQT